MKKNRKRKSFGYGPLYMLMGSCLVVVAAMIVALMFPDKITGTDQLTENVQIQSESFQGDRLNIDEVAETLEEEHGTQESLDMQEEQSTETIQNTEEDVTIEEPKEDAEISEETLFTVSDKSYFDDALFIGDSRTAGLQVYGTLDNADYFASAGLNLYTIKSAKIEVEKGKKIKLEQMLTDNAYGKVYIMLGINELGYDFDTTVEKYRAFIEYIFEKQPQAIIYVCANMHVNSLRDELDEIHNNAAINRMNEQISRFADEERVFYLDVNPLFDDEYGNLSQEYISDDTHLMGMYYTTWCDWYCQNTVLIEN